MVKNKLNLNEAFYLGNWLYGQTELLNKQVQELTDEYLAASAQHKSLKHLSLKNEYVDYKKQQIKLKKIPYREYLNEYEIVKTLKEEVGHLDVNQIDKKVITLEAKIRQQEKDNWIKLIVFLARIAGSPDSAVSLSSLSIDILLAILHYNVPVSSFVSLSKDRFMQCATFIMENSTELDNGLAQGQSFQIKESVNKNKYCYHWHFFTHQTSLKRKHDENNLDEDNMPKRIKF